MTPEQCRDYQIDAAKKPCYFTEHALGCECNGTQVRTANALWEIAAQLAELNSAVAAFRGKWTMNDISETAACLLNGIKPKWPQVG